MPATLPADPFAITALVIVTIEGEPIAKGAQGRPQCVIAAFETRQWVSILLVMAHVNRAQRMQIVMDKAQDLVEAFPGIADHLANLERGKATLHCLETRDGLEMIIAIGRHEGPRDGPVGEEAIINEVEALGF